MTIETAKLLKAIQVGYASWALMDATYYRYEKNEMMLEYFKEAEQWSLTGKIPPENMAKIEENLCLFNDNALVERIRDNIKKFEHPAMRNPIVNETIDYIKSL